MNDDHVSGGLPGESQDPLYVAFDRARTRAEAAMAAALEAQSAALSAQASAEQAVADYTEAARALGIDVDNDMEFANSPDVTDGPEQALPEFEQAMSELEDEIESMKAQIEESRAQIEESRNARGASLRNDSMEHASLEELLGRLPINDEALDRYTERTGREVWEFEDSDWELAREPFTLQHLARALRTSIEASEEVFAARTADGAPEFLGGGENSAEWADLEMRVALLLIVYGSTERDVDLKLGEDVEESALEITQFAGSDATPELTVWWSGVWDADASTVEQLAADVTSMTGLEPRFRDVDGWEFLVEGPQSLVATVAAALLRAMEADPTKNRLPELYNPGMDALMQFVSAEKE